MTSKPSSVREAWKIDSEYKGDYLEKLGCCGGDFCDNPKRINHNEEIADWWTARILASLDTAIERMKGEKPHARLCNSIVRGGFCDCGANGWNAAKSEITQWRSIRSGY